MLYHIALALLGALAFVTFNDVLTRIGAGNLRPEAGFFRTFKTPAVTPNFTASTDFASTIRLPNGVIRGFYIDIRGTLTGTITTVNAEGLARMVSLIEIVLPRPDNRSFRIRAPMRDLYVLSKLFGVTPRVLWPTSASAAYLRFFLPLEIPRNVANPHRWGIDTRELNGPMQVSGTWGTAAAYGQTSTGFTAGALRISPLIELGVKRNLPRAALVIHENRVDVDAAAKFDHELVTGEMDGLHGILWRTFDSSATGDADRPDGLITALKVETPGSLVLFDDFFDTAKVQMQEYFGIDQAELTQAAPHGYLGYGYSVFNRELVPNRYVSPQGIALEIDAVTAQLTGITDVVAASGDRVHAIAVGIQQNIVAQERAG